MRPAVLTLGTFDGVHRGHLAVLAEVTRRARAARLASVLVTFEPHPLAVVNPAAAPKLLTLPEEKKDLVTAGGGHRAVRADAIHAGGRAARRSSICPSPV